MKSLIEALEIVSKTRDLYNTRAPTSRAFETGHTYRIPTPKGVLLVWLEAVSDSHINFKNQKTGRIMRFDKDKAQRFLDEGVITLSA